MEERIQEAIDIATCAMNYPPVGHPRRTEDGYPTELIYDEFAYNRMVNSYRLAFRDIILLLKA